MTARRRDEGMQEVPISMTALSAGEIEARSITELKDITYSVPNLKFDVSAIKFSARVYLRGVGQNNSALTLDPRVGVYVDGVYVARPWAGMFDVLDAQRIEVLRGPQGTLFGKNTIGGAINVISAKPTGEFSGRVRVGAGNQDQFDTSAMINVPLIEETLFARAAVSTSETDGWITNQARGDARWPADRSQTARLSLRYLPTDDLEVLLTGDYYRSRGTNGLFSCEWKPLPGAALPGIVAALGLADDMAAACAAEEASSPDKSAADAHPDADSTIWGTSATLTWDLDWAQLRSITSFRHVEGRYALDADGSGVPYVEAQLGLDPHLQDQLSQELQLSGTSMDSRLNWVGGIYWFDEDSYAHQGSLILSCVISVLCTETIEKAGARSWAAYGEASYDLTERFSVTAGLRTTHERKEYDRINQNFVSKAISVQGNASERFNAWTPRFNVMFSATDTVHLYGGWSRGFTSGGFNNNDNLNPYEPEFAGVWEAGLKSEWLDQRLRVNFAYFYNDYEDVQLTVVRDIGAGNLVKTLQNAAEATIQGIELEVLATPFPGLRLSSGLGITDAEFDEYIDLIPPPAGSPPGTPPTPVDKSNLKFFHVPPVTFNVSAEYTVPEFFYGNLRLRADWSHRGKTHLDVNNSEDGLMHKVGLLGGRVTWELPDGKTEVALWGKNLLDRRYWRESSDLTDSIGVVIEQWEEPARYGIQITRHFGN